MSRLHRRIERRTGWLFGTYKARRPDKTSPWFAIGPTTCGSGLEEYPGGVWVTLGTLGLYVSRKDALERGHDRELNRIETYANRGDQ